MKSLYDQISYETSEHLTKEYSTSFSLSILLMPKKLRKAIYAIYGFVRVADEIVDTFLDYDQGNMLNEFKDETYKAIERGISTNPVLHCFQEVVRKYNIDHELIDAFLHSMEMDLYRSQHDQSTYEEYIYGSAEVVGLMCLKVFLNGDEAEYLRLKPTAKSLGSAFQKVNFLRDMKHDYQNLERVYFPGMDMVSLSPEQMKAIYDDIEKDFDYALEGIEQLPKSSRGAVYIAYKYYRRLFAKIRKMDTQKAFDQRIRIPNAIKFRILCSSYLRHQLNVL